MHQQHKAAFPGWGALLDSEVLLPEMIAFFRKYPDLRFNPGGWVAVSLIFRLGDRRRGLQELSILLDRPGAEDRYLELSEAFSGNSGQVSPGKMNGDMNEFDQWVNQASAGYLLRTHGRHDYVKDLLEGGSWREVRYRKTQGNPFRLSAWRFDFGVDPESFRKRMEEGRVVALFCKESGGDPVISRHPIASYKQSRGNSTRYACLYVLDEVAPGRLKNAEE